MVEYICELCGKLFSQKSHYDKHNNRKTPCLKKYIKTADLVKKNSVLKIATVVKDNDSFECDYCGKIFMRNWLRTRHIRDNCHVVREDINDKEKLFLNLVEEVEKLKKENKLLHKKIDDKNTTQIINNLNTGIINNINNSVNNHIKIVAFGKEDISHITDREWVKLLNRNYKSIEDLTLKTHFDKLKPENQNIYISNMRSKYIMVHDGKQWNIKDRKDTVDDLYDEKAYIIFNKVEELTEKSKLPIKIVDKFDKIKTGYDEVEIRKALIKDLDMTLYNQRNIPIYTHKIK